MSEDYAKKAAIFKAFCDENRLLILSALKGGEMCACKLLEVLNISQPTLSHHMKILAASGVVLGRKEGRWTHYSINPAGVDAALDIVKEFYPACESGQNEEGCN